MKKPVRPTPKPKVEKTQMADKKTTHKTKKNPDGSQTYSRGKTTREKSKGSDNRMVAAGKRSTAALDVYLNKKGRALTPAQKKAAWKKYTTESGVSTGISKNAADNYRRLSKERKLGALPKTKK